MEEIITIDGNQFQLSYDQPISPEQRLQAIEDIKTSIGCKTCGQTSQIRKLTATCTTTPKGSGDPISLNAAPMNGVAPYTVTFYKKVGINTPVQIGTKSNVNEAIAPTVGTVIPALSYTLTDEDVAGSMGDPSTTISATNPDGVALDPGKIRIRTVVTDSCVGAGGPATCEDFCDIPLICVTPTCNPIIGM